MIISAPSRKRFEYEEIQGSFLLPGGAVLPGKNAYAFELIVSDAVFEHISDECGTLDGLLDILAPGGHLVLLVDQEVSRRYPMHKPTDHLDHLERRGLTRIAATEFPVQPEFAGWWETGTISVWRKPADAGPALAGSVIPETGRAAPAWPKSLRFGSAFSMDSFITESLAHGPKEAQLREEVRVIIGRPSPVLSRELRETLQTVRRVLALEDILEGLSKVRDQVNDVFSAVVTILHARAGKERDRRSLSRLHPLLKIVRLVSPGKKPEIEVLDVGGYRGFLIDVIRSRLRRWPNYLCIDTSPIENPYGVSVTRMDSTQLSIGNNSVHQTYCLDVLEHMRNREQVRCTVGEIARVTADYAYIECPNFEDTEYLRGHGLKWFWSGWTDHTTPITLSLLEDVVAELCLESVSTVGYRETVYSSSHPQMVRQDAPSDTHEESADLASYRPPSEIRFDRAIHNRVFLRIQKNPLTVPFWESNHPASDLDRDAAGGLQPDPARTRALVASLLGEPLSPGVDLAIFAQWATEVLGKGAEAFLNEHGRYAARQLLGFLCVGLAQAERLKNQEEADAIRVLGRELEHKLS